MAFGLFDQQWKQQRRTPNNIPVVTCFTPDIPVNNMHAPIYPAVIHPTPFHIHLLYNMKHK